MVRSLVHRTRARPRDDRDALLGKAVVALRAGRPGEAERLAQQVRRKHRNFAPAAHLLGVIAGQTGRAQLAVELLREAIALDSTSVQSRNELVALLRRFGDLGESIALGREVINFFPDDSGAHNNLGMSLLAAGLVRDSVLAFERASVLSPSASTYHLNLGIARSKQGERAQALASFRRAAELETTAGGLVKLAIQLREAREYTEAERTLRRAIVADAANAEALELFAAVLREIGKFAEAQLIYSKAISVHPERVGGYFGLVLTRRMSELDRNLIEKMEALLKGSKLPEGDQARVHYALGKTSDDIGDYREAIKHFDEANRIVGAELKRSGRKLNRTHHVDNINRLIQTFDRDFLARQSQLGVQEELPIFVIGMIRSGTTLVEQILSTHPNVGAGGELRFWGSHGLLVRDIASGKFDSETARRLAGEYCSELRHLSPNALRVVDKMPTNFLLLGLIHSIFPKARIIHCRRNPIDTCLSIYFTPFDALPDFAGDRESILFYYHQYARLMEHWRSVLPPDRLFELNYESLIADREKVTRELIAFCGLDWVNRCLQHEQNRRVVSTPSMWQVRQPLYDRSVGRWRNYRKWLGAFEALMPTGVEQPERAEA